MANACGSHMDEARFTRFHGLANASRVKLFDY